ncbi:SMI1/KNR4 family protein [Escherichia fergusonii]|uniref:SMI1/KNR4 family protein n=2 Tax=Escherichia fergusonii TaxID=564 RepID=UPI002016D484|nr:SMI1/KNR4 family protein [Escherichia fergusonii]MEB8050121.1 SMI1/KNR4 family protein [Escherichia fergusonii]MEB8054180.1 SMI1/KNR4 family protein [Escherichia fergusonii]
MKKQNYVMNHRNNVERSVYIDELNKHISIIESKKFVVKGCTIDQIQQLENKYGELPLFYKIFLSLLGESSGDFKQGTDILFKDIDDINECTIELMQDNNIDVPYSMFSFLLHQGYSALFFIEKDDDPYVYCYTEGREIEKTKFVFSEYVLAEIDLYKKYQCDI